MGKSLLYLLLVIVVGTATAAEPRARDLGIPFDGVPGALDAITDVPGVTVGEVTLIKDLPDGHKVRTGVTAILPRGRTSLNVPAFAAWFPMNGNGEMTGTTWLQGSGVLNGPVMLTNTLSVGTVRDATIAWCMHHRQNPPGTVGYCWSALPVVAETYDGYLNDVNGFHVVPADAWRALDDAHGGPVAEGNVGGGTGMICYEFKCGTGTASRVVRIDGHAYSLGVLVQANFGLRRSLLIAGAPVGQYLTKDRVYSERNPKARERGSIIIVIATDAPLLPDQLKRVAKRASEGLGRLGSYSGNGSGDIFLAFSTANAAALQNRPLQQASFVGNHYVDPLFEATVQAVDESVVNAMVAARDMCGEDGHCAEAIPHAPLISLLKRFGRYAKPSN